jgi:protein-S-isoprenylcysteine O-methyltransferase Ste14
MTGWFGPKLTGYGVGPRSWQGWLVSLVVLLAIVGSRFIMPESFGLPHWSRAAAIGIVIVLYLLLVWFTYEGDE